MKRVVISSGFLLMLSIVLAVALVGFTERDDGTTIQRSARF
jgi:hypothetical protein